MEHSNDLTSSTQLPRLRVTRNTLTDSTNWRKAFNNNPLGSDPDLVSIPQDYPSTSEDEYALNALKNSNSRLLSGSLPLVDDSAHTSETSHRLKSILERFDNANREFEATPRASMPPTPSEPDSDFEHEPSQAARHSIRSLIENALREPGDTPQKLKSLRRASFNASDSPKVDQSGPKNWSDEEREAQLRNASQAESARLVSNFRQFQDQSTPQPSTFQAKTSITPRFSKLSLQSGSVIRPKSHKDLEPFRPISSESALSSPEKVKFSKPHRSVLDSSPDLISLHLHKKAKDLSKAHILNVAADSSHLRPVSPNLTTSPSRTPSPSHGRRTTSPSAWPVPPPPGSSPSSVNVRKLSHRGSDNSLKDASSNTSASAAEYRERIKDLDRERERELELGWNRHRVQHSPVPSTKHVSKSISSASSTQNRQHGQSLKSSRPWQKSGFRSDSPTSTQDEDTGEQHERERDWNSSIPKWNHTHGHNSRNVSPSTSHEHSSYHTASFQTPRSRHMSEHTSQRAHSPRLPVKEASPSSTTSPLINSENDPEFTQQQSEMSVSKTTSVMSNTGSWGGNARSKLNASSLNDSSNPHTPFRKKHRRTITTEVSELELADPVAPSLAVSDSSTESFEPPHMSTPTSKSPKSSAGATPPSSPPPSPNGSFSKATIQADLARLQKAVQPVFTFPPRSSSQPPSQNLTIGTTDWKGELTPATISVDDAHTPMKLEQDVDSTYFKTPRPPGAFGTPYTRPSKAEYAKPVEQSPEVASVDDNDTKYLGNDGMETLSTPAPPGAYRMTPGSAKRKGILKVRFNDPEPNVVPEPSEQDVLQQSNLGEHTTNSEADLESPTRRKGLRLVDEYGRVRKFTEDGTEVFLDRKGTTYPSDTTTQQSTHSLSGIEPVNLNAVEKTTTESISMVETAIYDKNQLENTTLKESEYSFESKDKKAVVSRLTKSLGEMQATLTRGEALAVSVPMERTMDNGRLNSLSLASRIARLEREKLVRRLELEKDAEGKIQSRVFTARNTSSLANRRPWWLRKWRLLLFSVIVELCLLCLWYLIALRQSKRLWLGTHFDPFYPALYIHKSHVRFLSQLGTLPVSWSAFTVPATIPGSNEMGYAMESFGKRFWDTIFNWKLGSWESWGDALKDSSLPQAWPS